MKLSRRSTRLQRIDTCFGPNLISRLQCAIETLALSGLLLLQGPSPALCTDARSSSLNVLVYVYVACADENTMFSSRTQQQAQQMPLLGFYVH